MRVRTRYAILEDLGPSHKWTDLQYRLVLSAFIDFMFPFSTSPWSTRGYTGIEGKYGVGRTVSVLGGLGQGCKPLNGIQPR
jgi:hypothetical protein